MEQKRFGWPLMLVVALVLGLSACNKDDDEVKLDFEITAPDGWNYYKLGQGEFQYYAVSPLTSSTDTVYEDFTVARYALQGRNLTGFFNDMIGDLTEDTSFYILYASDTTINEEPAKKLIHLLTVQGVETGTNDTVYLHTKSVRYVMAKNSYGYIVNCAALPSTWSLYIPIFEAVIASFRFI